MKLQPRRCPSPGFSAFQLVWFEPTRLWAGSGLLSAKSRIVLPGHLDPYGGLVRTDAPTTQMSSVRMAIVLGLSRGWKFMLFDVATAFLSGREVDRDLYVKPPRDLKCAGTSTLWRILKSVGLRLERSLKAVVQSGEELASAAPVRGACLCPSYLREDADDADPEGGGGDFVPPCG